MNLIDAQPTARLQPTTADAILRNAEVSGALIVGDVGQGAREEMSTSPGALRQ